MYNGKYGLFKYGLKNGATKVVKVYGDLSESVLSIAGFGETIDIISALDERMLNTSMLYATCLLDGDLQEKIIMSLKVRTCYNLSSTLNETLSNESCMHKDIYLIRELKDGVNADCYASKNMYFELGLKDEINGELYLGKILYVQDTFLAEQVNADVSAVVLEKQIAILNVVVPPGGELRVDSNTFNATLNGENILHLYDGDWITISRDTISLAVQTATGGKLTGKLLYTERYL